MVIVFKSIKIITTYFTPILENILKKSKTRARYGGACL
jgi:hypothetical protein